MKVIYLSLLVYLFQLPLWIIGQFTALDLDCVPLLGNLLCLVFLIMHYKAGAYFKVQVTWSLQKTIIVVGLVALLELIIGASLVATLLYIGNGFTLGDIPSTPGISLSICSVLNVVIIAPILEEVLFRGIIFDQLRNRQSERKANFIQALAFSATHFSLIKFPGHFISGLLYGLIRIKSKSISIPIVLHMFTNAMVCLSLYLLNNL